MSMEHVKELLARWDWMLEHHHRDEGPSITIRDAIVSLEVAIRKDDTPQIIRTVEELEALDPETVVLDATGYLVRTRGLVMNGKPQAFLPALVVASADQVRAARKALEEADA